MNLLDLNVFREITWSCGFLKQPFWEFKNWKLGILISIFYWEQYRFRVVVTSHKKKKNPDFGITTNCILPGIPRHLETVDSVHGLT
jgi:hypothetical protein